MLSANHQDTIKRQAVDLLVYLKKRPESFYLSLLSSLTLTLQRRSLFSWNIAFSVTSKTELVSALERPNLSPRRNTKQPRIAFLFTGQGAQWFGMGRELLQTYPAFKSTIEAAEKCLWKLGAKWLLSGISPLRSFL